MIHNQLTNYVQLMAGFRRMLGEMGADFSGIERAGETLQPVMDLWALPEWALLRGEVLFSRQTSIAAQAGLFTSWELVNPAGSGIIAVALEYACSQNSLFFSVDSGAALGAGTANRGVANDTRFPQLGEVSRCTLNEGNLAAGVVLSQDFILTTQRVVRPYVIVPGKKLFISTGAVNQAATLSIYWTERVLVRNEQNGAS